MKILWKRLENAIYILWKKYLDFHGFWIHIDTQAHFKYHQNIQLQFQIIVDYKKWYKNKR